MAFSFDEMCEFSIWNSEQKIRTCVRTHASQPASRFGSVSNRVSGGLMARGLATDV